jgi:DNA mismatch repair protein MutS
VHLSAVEHKDSIVFLHTVQPGPASQSYGLQVAQLAGVPQAVIRAARKHLAALEAHSLQPTPQYDLFAHSFSESTTLGEAQEPEPEKTVSMVIQALQDINPDDLSPREALDALYRLKNVANHQ